MFTLTQKLMTSSDRLTNRTRRGLPDRLSSPRNSVSGTTLSNRSTDATNFLHITKWIFDRVVALLGLLVLWPVLVVVAIMVKVKIPGGPAFFVQKRVGKDG